LTVGQKHKKESRFFGQDLSFLMCMVQTNITKEEWPLYNLGSGNARTFNEMASAIFSALQIPTKISYFDTPIDIRNTYQYFTEANMDKLKKAGYYNDFMTIEEGVKDYIQQYLQTNQYL
jgi:ADP-L-glycero-D-manno-heptose 6-epimerase